MAKIDLLQDVRNALKMLPWEPSSTLPTVYQGEQLVEEQPKFELPIPTANIINNKPVFTMPNFGSFLEDTTQWANHIMETNIVNNMKDGIWDISTSVWLPTMPPTSSLLLGWASQGTEFTKNIQNIIPEAKTYDYWKQYSIALNEHAKIHMPERINEAGLVLNPSEMPAYTKSIISWQWFLQNKLNWFQSSMDRNIDYLKSIWDNKEAERLQNIKETNVNNAVNKVAEHNAILSRYKLDNKNATDAEAESFYIKEINSRWYNDPSQYFSEWMLNYNWEPASITQKRLYQRDDIINMIQLDADIADRYIQEQKTPSLLNYVKTELSEAQKITDMLFLPVWTSLNLFLQTGFPKAQLVFWDMSWIMWDDLVDKNNIYEVIYSFLWQFADKSVDAIPVVAQIFTTKNIGSLSALKNLNLVEKWAIGIWNANRAKVITTQLKNVIWYTASEWLNNMMANSLSSNQVTDETMIMDLVWSSIWILPDFRRMWKELKYSFSEIASSVIQNKLIASEIWKWVKSWMSLGQARKAVQWKTINITTDEIDKIASVYKDIRRIDDSERKWMLLKINTLEKKLATATELDLQKIQSELGVARNEYISYDTRVKSRIAEQHIMSELLLKPNMTQPEAIALVKYFKDSQNPRVSVDMLLSLSRNQYTKSASDLAIWAMEIHKWVISSIDSWVAAKTLRDIQWVDIVKRYKPEELSELQVVWKDKVMSDIYDSKGWQYKYFSEYTTPEWKRYMLNDKWLEKVNSKETELSTSIIRNWWWDIDSYANKLEELWFQKERIDKIVSSYDTLLDTVNTLIPCIR